MTTSFPKALGALAISVPICTVASAHPLKTAAPLATVGFKPTASGLISAHGVQIAYEDFGPRNRPVILLIMGTDGQLIDWPITLCRDLVNRGFRVIRFDNRDSGLSTNFDSAGLPDWAAVFASMGSGKAPPLAYTLNDMADDAVGLLDALAIKKAHLVGASMGGMIAQIIATRYPDRALSLTSIMAGSGNPAYLAPAKPELLAAIPPEPAPGDIDAIIARRIKLWKAIGSPAFPVEEQVLLERVARDVKRAYRPGGAARQGAATLTSGDRRNALRTIKVPTIVVHGDADPVVSPAAGREVADHIPGAMFRLIPGMGHDLPDALIPTIEDAITTVSESQKAVPTRR
jgi:pimeloyl-ACP methyl ester carboxylesterase